MANPSGTHNEPAQPSHGSVTFNDPINGGNSVSAPENSAATPVLQHNSGISMDWTAEEQSILEEGLGKYASESNLSRYARIAMQLQNKTVRDVALRCRWMTEKENRKRWKEDHSLARKSKDKKEKVTDPSAKSSHLAAQTGGPAHAQGMLTNDNDDGISYNAVGGPSGQLLQQNALALEKISANFDAHQIDENISLFRETRDNILKILNNLSDMSDIMKQMPPLPVKVNEELANSILPHTTLPMQ